MLGDHLEALHGRVAMIATRDQLQTALALVELDGIARRIVLCTPDLDAGQLAQVAAASQADAIVLEAGAAIEPPPGPLRCWMTPRPVARTALLPLDRHASGVDRMGAADLGHHRHAEARCAHAGEPGRHAAAAGRRRPRRLEHLLRHPPLRRPADLPARAAGGALARAVAAPTSRSPTFWRAPRAAGVTHISGTPSHWRRALMSGVRRASIAALRAPVRRDRRPGACSTACAPPIRARASPMPSPPPRPASRSTCNDGLAGFPAAFVGARASGVEMQVEDGTLRIRSQRTAAALSRRRRARWSATTASSIPAIWWSCAAAATISSAAAAA